MTSRTRDEKLYNHCNLCKYFHLEVQQGGGWLEICEVTGGRVIDRERLIEALVKATKPTKAVRHE